MVSKFGSTRYGCLCKCHVECEGQTVKSKVTGAYKTVFEHLQHTVSKIAAAQLHSLAVNGPTGNPGKTLVAT